MSFFKNLTTVTLVPREEEVEGEPLPYTWAAVRSDLDPSASYPYKVEVRTMDGHLMGESIASSPENAAETAKRLALIYKRNLNLPNECSGQGVV